MPNIVDSIFIELGVDVSKFSADQKKALQKIAEFEAKAKKSGKGAGDAIQSVGDAFRNLAKETRVGASAAGVDQLAKKLQTLGKSAQVAGIFGGAAAEGLGMLLSPTALGIAAVGMLGKEMWDLNKVMTANDAVMERQAQLSDMNAKSLWSWGEAARAVGANPQDVTGGISTVQQSIAGMMIGAGDATPQLVALARLGLGWNAQSGLNDDQVSKMFERVHTMAAAKGYKNLGALRALTGPIMNDAMFNVATDPEFDPATFQKQIAARAPANLNKIFQDSLKSQMALGKLDIDTDILKQTAYGSEQGLMQAVVEILRSLLGVVTRIADYFVGPDKAPIAARIKDWFGRSPETTRNGMASAMKTLMASGMSENDAASMVGNMMQESSMDPLARGPGGHVGLLQWDGARQRAFAKRFGYPIGTGGVPADKQFNDQLMFSMQEPEYMAASRAMAKVKSLMAKTAAFMNIDERPGDNSLSRRYDFALDAKRFAEAANDRAGAVQHNVSSEVHIGEINMQTPPTDTPGAYAEALLKGVATHPLMSPAAQGTVSLATRAFTG